ncbi:hypothetical protein PG993_008878 [Apiospora rasikravindrae]|uniref:Uncharacterized protein n=1 Tax=Apiospora rasikravindrae TaxID=990691 RepID=A0ABR1SPL6_9PEZI
MPEQHWDPHYYYAIRMELSRTTFSELCFVITHQEKGTTRNGNEYSEQLAVDRSDTVPIAFRDRGVTDEFRGAFHDAWFYGVPRTYAADHCLALGFFQLQSDVNGQFAPGHLPAIMFRLGELQNAGVLDDFMRLFNEKLEKDYHNFSHKLLNISSHQGRPNTRTKNAPPTNHLRCPIRGRGESTRLRRQGRGSRSTPKPGTPASSSPTKTSTKTSTTAKPNKPNIISSLFRVSREFGVLGCVPQVLPLVTSLPHIPSELLGADMIKQALAQTTLGLDQVCEYQVTGTAGAAFSSFLPTWYGWYDEHANREIRRLVEKCPKVGALTQTAEAYRSCAQVVAIMGAATATEISATATATGDAKVEEEEEEEDDSEKIEL